LEKAKLFMQAYPTTSNPEVTKNLPPTLVLGVGNILQQDDGLGVRVVERLAERQFPAHITLRDAGTPGIDLVNQMEGWSRVYIIDAAYIGEEPGEWRRYDSEDVKLIAQAHVLSLHEQDVASALTLAEALHKLPDECILYAVEPQQVGWGEQLSPPIKAAIPALVDQITNELLTRER
jgi:hydrogenase maturation protease